MKLDLRQLKNVANIAIDEHKLCSLLKEELKNTFGPTIPTSRKLDDVALHVNEMLDVFESTGKKVPLFEKQVLLHKLSEHRSPTVRKMIVRLLSEDSVKKFLNDTSDDVRHAAARRCTSDVIKKQ